MLVLQKLLTASTEIDCFASLHIQSLPYSNFSSFTIIAKVYMRYAKKNLAYYCIKYPTNTQGKPHPETVSAPFQAWVLLRRTGLLRFQGLWKLSSQNLHVDAQIPTLR